MTDKAVEALALLTDAIEEAYETTVDPLDNEDVARIALAYLREQGFEITPVSAAKINEDMK